MRQDATVDEVLKLRAEVARLQELLRGVGANRYWEGRWRDEVAVSARLNGELFWLRDRVRTSEQTIQFALLGETGMCWECGDPVQTASASAPSPLGVAGWDDTDVQSRPPGRDGLWCLHSNPSLCKFPDCTCPPRKP